MRNYIQNNIYKFNKSTFLFTRSKIKEKILLNDHSKDGVKITFYSKAQVGKDNYVLRFLLPETDAVAGFNTCQYVLLESPNKGVKRPYHPISLDSDTGFVDFLIKVYSGDKSGEEGKGINQYGLFSNYLANLQEGEVVKMTGPFGNIQYNGKGEFLIKNSDNSLTRKKVNKIGMIAGGTGISPMFHLIQKIVSSRFDGTGLSLIYSARYIEDMALTEDLIKYDRSGRISFYPVVSQPEIGNKWKYGVGRVSEEMIENFMPSAKDKDSVLILCGPHGMVEHHLKPMLRTMAYPEENILSFH